MSSITAPATALAGHGLTFTYHVTNAGAGATPNDPGTTPTTSRPPRPTTRPRPSPSTADSQRQPGRRRQLHQHRHRDGPQRPERQLLPPRGDRQRQHRLRAGQKQNNGAPRPAPSRSPRRRPTWSSPPPAPRAAVAGSAILVNWTVTNQGSGDTVVSSWQDDVYVDTGTTLDSNAVLLGSFTHNGLLDPGGSYTQSQLVTLPINLSGPTTSSWSPTWTTKSMKATRATTPLRLPTDHHQHAVDGPTAPIADLQVTSVTRPDTALAGGSVTVSWTVQNNGPGTTNSNYWYDDIWLSTNTTLGSSGGTDILPGHRPAHQPARRGRQLLGVRRLTVPRTWPPATTTSSWSPTPERASVYQTSYTNNANNDTRRRHTAVSVPPLPDLTVSSITAPATATSGGSWRSSWTVTNSGPGAQATCRSPTRCTSRSTRSSIRPTVTSAR